MFNTIDEALNWLYSQKKLSKRENLERIELCAKKLLLKPNYKIIHIAGTNGKGSTASYIKSILKNTGIHVGFFVSPFVVCFNERIQINDRYISNAEILHYTNILYEYSSKYFEEYNDVIPFFELTFLMALLYFQDRNIDIAIIECGVGGLLDATNFLKTDLAIITNIGYDHMNTLGNTLKEIATHKLGIVKDNMTCLTCVCDELKPYFLEYAKTKNAKMIFVDEHVKDIVIDSNTRFIYKNIEYSASLLGKYQAYNTSLAIEAVQYLNPNIEYDLIQFGLNEVKWPGRMEILKDKPFILLDGAHNIHGIDALVDTMKEFKQYKIKILFSALHDKAFDLMLNKLDGICDFYYFTSMEDLRATNPIEFSKFTNKAFVIISDFRECINKAISELKPDELLLITGSLHFISMVRNYYLETFKTKE